MILFYFYWSWPLPCFDLFFNIHPQFNRDLQALTDLLTLHHLKVGNKLLSSSVVPHQQQVERSFRVVLLKEKGFLQVITLCLCVYCVFTCSFRPPQSQHRPFRCKAGPVQCIPPGQRTDSTPSLVSPSAAGLSFCCFPHRLVYPRGREAEESKCWESEEAKCWR